MAEGASPNIVLHVRQMSGVCEACCVCGTDEVVALHEELPRSQQPAPKLVGSQWHAGLFDEDMAKTAWRQMHCTSHLFEGRRIARTRTDVVDRLQNPWVRGNVNESARKRAHQVPSGALHCASGPGHSPRPLELADEGGKPISTEELDLASQPCGQNTSLRCLRLDEQHCAPVASRDIDAVLRTRGDKRAITWRPLFATARLHPKARRCPDDKLNGVVRMRSDPPTSGADEKTAPPSRR
jgi:hypothetical protein